MSIRNMLFVTAFVLASLGAAHADGVRPMEAKSVDLGGISGIAYYTIERDGLHVVTTLAQGETGVPFRVVSVLAPGQSVVLSAQNVAGVIEIRRNGDSLSVRSTIAGTEAVLPTSNPTEGNRATTH
ncbi:hypothetical protein [Bradyrhizobium sp. Tv2a-2]|uniref:hypothetical protein n=1 Tax=Bradyrhizobium sp. Tv2a-2 TaxID=113395 RepID=UPI0004211867|nr:hypothetical protein [Bradyrhizobium sp. Tv2a-2]